MWWLVCLVVLAVSFVLKFKAKRLKHIPGPPQHWFWGGFKDAKKNFARMHDWSLEETRKHGMKSWAISFPFRRTVVILAPTVENAEFVLREQFEHFPKNPWATNLGRELFGYGIFAVDGEAWKKERKLASHMFNMKSLRDHMVDVFIKHGESVVEFLDAKVKSGESVDFQELYLKYSLTTFAEIGFGRDLDEIRGESPFGKAFDEAQHAIVDRTHDPLWPLKRLRWGARERKLKEAIECLHKFTRESIQARRQDIMRGDRRDLISRWIIKGEEDKEPVSDAYLVDVMMNFLIAGRDTTACALTWCTYILTKRADVLAKVLQELRTVNRASYDSAKEMEYTEAVLNETIRLYPPVPTNSKLCTKDVTLPDGTFVPAGTVVSYRPYTFGRVKELWGEDAEEFDPERWLREEQAVSPFKFISFNAGPRVCLGRFVAILEMKILFAVILPRYKFSFIENHPEVTYEMDMILKMKHGLHLKVEKR